MRRFMIDRGDRSRDARRPQRPYGTLLALIVTTLAVGLTDILPASAQNAGDRLRFEAAPDRSIGVAPLRYPMTTDFGTWVPYRVPVASATIGRTEGTLASDLGNLRLPSTVALADLPARARGLLVRDGVAVDDRRYGTFGALYNAAESTGTSVDPTASLPPFITLDAGYLGFRATARDAYRSAVDERLYDDLQNLLASLSGRLFRIVEDERRGPVAESGLRLLVWTETARRILDPDATVDERVLDAVDREIERIEAGERAEGPFGLDVDYADYRPAGSSRIDRYESTRLWVAATGPSISGEESRAAALLARVVDGFDTHESTRLADLTAIETFFGGADDRLLSLDAIAGGLRSWFGFRYESGYAYLADDREIADVRRYLERYRDPAVDREMQTGLLPLPASNTSMLGLLDDPDRLVAVLRDPGGSELGRSIANRPAEEWVGTLDDLALYLTSSLLEPTTAEGLPGFMRSRTWAERRRASFLGGFGLFGVDPIAIDAPATTLPVATNRSSDAIATGWVEPDPAAWAGLAAAASYVRRGLTEGVRGQMIDESVERRLRDIEATAMRLSKIAAEQLLGRQIDGADADLLASMPARVAAWESSTTDRSLRLVAGARNGSTTALGHPRVIYVAVPDRFGGFVLMRGGLLDHRTHEGGSWRSVVLGSGAGARASDAMIGVDATISAPADQLASVDSRAAGSGVRVDFESSLVRRSSGAVWYTILAEGFNRFDVIATVIDNAGRTIWRSQPMTIDEGERYDMVPTEALRTGTYFIRVSDISGAMLASGRFVIVR